MARTTHNTGRSAMRADAVVFLLCFCPPTAELNLFKAKRKTFVSLYKGYRVQTGDFLKRTAPAPKPLCVTSPTDIIKKRMTSDMEMTILKEVSVDKSFKAILYSNNIVQIDWDPSLELIDVIHLNQIRNVLLEYGGGRKMPVYFATRSFLNISEAARKDASTEEGAKYTLANAVLIGNLAQKIVFNFFMNINQPKVPTKGFSNKEEAFRWLKKLQ